MTDREQTNQAWEEATEHLKSLSALFVERYQHYETEPGTPPPSEDEVRAALKTLGNSASAAVAAFSDVATDPDVRSQTRLTAGTLVEAVAASVSGLVEDLAKPPEPLGEAAQRSPVDEDRADEEAAGSTADPADPARVDGEAGTDATQESAP